LATDFNEFKILMIYAYSTFSYSIRSNITAGADITVGAGTDKTVNDFVN
jgi:hypothetical protein